MDLHHRPAEDAEDVKEASKFVQDLAAARVILFVAPSQAQDASRRSSAMFDVLREPTLAGGLSPTGHGPEVSEATEGLDEMAPMAVTICCRRKSHQARA